MEDRPANPDLLQSRKEMNSVEPHRLTPVETTKEQKRRIQDEITRQIAFYLAKGGEIKQIPTGQGAGNSEQNF